MCSLYLYCIILYRRRIVCLFPFYEKNVCFIASLRSMLSWTCGWLNTVQHWTVHTVYVLYLLSCCLMMADWTREDMTSRTKRMLNSWPATGFLVILWVRNLDRWTVMLWRDVCVMSHVALFRIHCRLTALSCRGLFSHSSKKPNRVVRGSGGSER